MMEYLHMVSCPIAMQSHKLMFHVWNDHITSQDWRLFHMTMCIPTLYSYLWLTACTVLLATGKCHQKVETSSRQQTSRDGNALADTWVGIQGLLPHTDTDHCRQVLLSKQQIAQNIYVTKHSIQSLVSTAYTLYTNTTRCSIFGTCSEMIIVLTLMGPRQTNSVQNQHWRRWRTAVSCSASLQRSTRAVWACSYRCWRWASAHRQDQRSGCTDLELPVKPSNEIHTITVHAI